MRGFEVFAIHSPLSAVGGEKVGEGSCLCLIAWNGRVRLRLEQRICQIHLRCSFSDIM